MNFPWHLTRTMQIDAAAARLHLGKLDKVLLAHDGPQLTVVRDEWRTYLDYAADDDGDELVRWIRSDVTSVELKALHRGTISVRDAVAKSEVTVFDKMTGGRVVGSWKVARVSLPDACLPEAGAELPGFARDPDLATPRGCLAFECDGGSVRDNAISFACLAAITAALQRLWKALAQRAGAGYIGEWSDATLAFAAGHTGSFAIEVVAQDQERFDAIATRYKALVRDCYSSPAALRKHFDGDPGLGRAYTQLARTLDEFKIDVFADWRSDAAFFGNDCARSFAPSPRTRRHDGEDDDESQEIVVVTGYFDGFMRKKHKFQFVNAADDSEYFGDIERDDLQGTEIVVDPGTEYSARIEVVQGEDGVTRHKLLSVKRL